MPKRQRIIRQCILACVILISITACQVGEKKISTFTEADSGKTIRIKKDENLQFVLIRDPQSDLEWDTQGYDQTLLKPATPLLGDKVDKVFLGFEPLARGTTTLRFVYHQRAHPEIPPSKTFEVTVTIE